MNDAALVNPSGTILIGERQNGDWPANPSNNINYYAATSNEYKDSVTAVHFDGSNIAFADGHVKWLKVGQDVAPQNLWDNQ